MSSYWHVYMRRFLHPLLLILAIAFLSSGCSSRREVKAVSLNNQSPEFLLSKVEENAFSYEALSGKLSAELHSPDQNNSFRVNFRIRHDSAAWFSITPALGIEAIRILVTTDSIKYINKIQKTYFLGRIDQMEEKFGVSLNFSNLESILTGNFLLGEPDDEYRSADDNGFYVLSAKVPRRLRKAAGIKPRNQKTVPDSLYREPLKEKKLKKAQDKFDDEDLILKRYWIYPDSYRLRGLLLDDIPQQTALIVDYPELMPIESSLFPETIDLEILREGQRATLGIKYSRVRMETSVTMPFSIPSSYEPAK